MRPPAGPRPARTRRRARAWLDLDARLTSGLHALGDGFARLHADLSARSDRLRVRGGRRFLAELAGEAATYGTFGLVAALALAVPAMKTTRGDKLSGGDLAVTFLDRSGREVGRRGVRQDDSVALDDIPDSLIRATLATEDRRFFEHWGVDPIGTARALVANARASGVVQGGSTLSQQLAKNIFLTNERSLERKLREAYLALWLESRYTKRQILKMYLDRAYMGGGVFGVSAAAEFYFGKPVQALSLAESAMLAGLYKAPTRYAPHANLPAARARAGDVLSNLVEAGFMTEAQVAGARREPATAVDRSREATPDWYLDYAFAEVQRLADAGAFKGEHALSVRLAIDADLQVQADRAIETSLRTKGAAMDATQAAVVVLDPDGALRAMVGGRDYGASQFNRAVSALRQPGSAFKPFVYAAALETGRFTPKSIVPDAPVCLGTWCPNNYTRSYAGNVPLSVALAKSYNTVPVRLSVMLGNGNAKLGRARIVDLVRRMGITTEIVDASPLPIGALEVTVLEITSAYAVFANGGLKAPPHAVLEVRGPGGSLVWSHERDGPRPERVLPASVVADMDGMMHRVVEEGTGRRARIPGHPVAGKTGTTNAYRDAWFVGFTGSLVAGVWFGNDDNTVTDGMTGGTVPAETWQSVMSYAAAAFEPKPLPGVPLGPAPAAGPALVNGRGSPGGAGDLAEVRRPAVLPPRLGEALAGVEEMLNARPVQQLGSRIPGRTTSLGVQVIR